ncbi:MAG: ABC transporter permease [Bacteroidetes bacterium]|nr:ABC transporter permease [Bacteroidota bacterium]
MKFPLYVAFRYVFSKNKANAANLISGITLSAFAICAAAMLIVLSALNGFENTLTKMFSSFDPQIKIEAVKGKTFYPDKILKEIENVKGVSNIALTLEDIAVLKYGESQEIAVIKGVSENYTTVTGIDSLVFDGKFVLNKGVFNCGVFGYVLSDKLGLNLDNSMNFVTVFVPSKGEISTLNPEQNIISERILPSAKFYVHEDIDSRYVLSSLVFAQNLFSAPNKVSALEISIDKNFSEQKILQKLKNIAGKNFKVKNRYEQKESFYKIFKSEKLATIAILSFILLIAAFNMTGSVTMLILEKQKDITILKSFGATNALLSKIFINSGLIIAFAGCLIGLAIGSGLVLLQSKYGLLKLENSVIDAYPVAFKALDFFIIIAISLIIGLVTSWIAARKIN